MNLEFDYTAGAEIIAILPTIYLLRFKEDKGGKELIFAWLFFHFMISWGGKNA